jgi:hypothetical protein
MPGTKHIVLEIEVPSIYVEDVEKLYEELGGERIFDDKSEFILNTIGEPGPCIISTEVSGEKDSDVITVWGRIRGAHLIDATGETEEHLEEIAGYKLGGDPDDAVRVAVERQRTAGVDLDDLIDAVSYELGRLRREKDRQPLS